MSEDTDDDTMTIFIDDKNMVASNILDLGRIFLCYSIKISAKICFCHLLQICWNFQTFSQRNNFLHLTLDAFTNYLLP